MKYRKRKKILIIYGIGTNITRIGRGESRLKEDFPCKPAPSASTL
jgi:hypothetical protein